MKLVAIIPAFEAERSVGDVVTALRRELSELGANDVVVVDDGSSDRTGDIARRAGARVLEHRVNRGKGAALQSGFAYALERGADAALTLDADGQHPAEEAARVGRSPAPRQALVLGVRDLGRAGAPLANRFSNGFSNLFLSRFGGRRLSDTQCGLRRYPLPETPKLGASSPGYAFEAEVLLRAARLGWPIVEVPVRVVYSKETRASSHFNSVRDPARIVLSVLETTLTVPRRQSP